MGFLRSWPLTLECVSSIRYIFYWKTLPLVGVYKWRFNWAADLWNCQFNGLNWSLLVKHLEFDDIHNLDYIVSLILLNLGHVFPLFIVSLMWRQTADDAKAKHVSQVQEDKWNNVTKSCAYLQIWLKWFQNDDFCPINSSLQDLENARTIICRNLSQKIYTNAEGVWKVVSKKQEKLRRKFWMCRNSAWCCFWWCHLICWSARIKVIRKCRHMSFSLSKNIHVVDFNRYF